MTNELDFTENDEKLKPEYLSRYLDVPNWNVHDTHVLINLVNDILREKLAKAPVVVKAAGYGHHDTWIESYDGLDGPPSHRALLVGIEEIK